MNKFLAIALLCVSAASAATDYIVGNVFTDTAACGGTAFSSTANPANVCIPSQYATSSSYYTYDPNFPGNFTSTTYYTAKDCSGAFVATITNFSVCAGGQSYTYSSGAPKFNGLVSVTSNTCGGAPVGAISSVNLGACIPSGASASIKTVWYGGSQCVFQQFTSADCSGTPDQSPLGGPRCDQTTHTTTGCQINGAFLPASTLSPTYPSNAQVLVTKYYNLRTDCTGQVEFTSYSRLASCDGEGSATSIVNNKAQVNLYDNYNCTGVLLKTQTSDDSTIGTCDAGNDSSSITTTGSFPASVNSPVAIIQSSCAAGATIYSAYVYASGCIQINSTASGTVACSTLSNGTLQIQSNTYGNTGCTGPVVETEIDLEAACTADPDQPGIAYRYACSAQFSPSSSSPASTIAIAFSVMIMSFIAALLM